MATGGESEQTKAYAAAVLAPLSEEEAAQAVQAALEALAAGHVAQDDLRVYAPRLRIDKPGARDEAPTRSVWVRVRERSRRAVHEVVVRDGTVVQHEVSRGSSPPFSAEELGEAARLVAGESGLRELLDQAGTELEWFSPGHGDDRVVGVRVVRVENHRVVEDLGAAAVDLDAMTVVERGGRRG